MVGHPVKQPGRDVVVGGLARHDRLLYERSVIYVRNERCQLSYRYGGKIFSVQ
jgi:hypothetical protein